LITRKTLGGMQTDLASRVLSDNGEPIGGLYAVGEAAGFGGGGITGLRCLEGHCLSACIMNAQAAAQSIAAA
jgi:predicted oxidoreductase